MMIGLKTLIKMFAVDVPTENIVFYSCLTAIIITAMICITYLISIGKLDDVPLVQKLLGKKDDSNDGDNH